MTHQAHPAPVQPSWHNTAAQRLALVMTYAPGVWLLAAWVGGTLGANPVGALLTATGRVALILLLASLAFTPLNTLFGLRWAFRTRRILGVGSFVYALLHFLILIGLDYGFDLQFLLLDGVASMPFILVGLLALALMAPLAATSNAWSVKRLGIQRWKRLHALVYPSGVLVIIHFFWQAKAAERLEPLLYGLALLLLLGLRLPGVTRRLARRQAPTP